MTIRTEEAGTSIPPHLRRLALTVMLGAFLVGLDATMTNVAINTFLTEFDAPLTTVQWISTAYLLAMTMTIPVTGWAADRFGTRAMWLTGIGVFLAGSVLCGTAWSATSLILFRVLQGIGGGMLLPLAQAILARAGSRQLIGRMMAFVGVPAMLGPVLGPVLGGLLLDHAGWRWIFLVNLPVCVLALVAAVRVMSPQPRDPDAGHLDVRGLVLLPPACAALVYGLAEVGHRGTFADRHVVIALALGGLLLVTFVVHALRLRTMPLIDLRLLGSRSFAASAGLMFLAGLVLFGAVSLLPLYLQQVRGYSAVHAGLLLAPQGLGMGVSLILAGRLLDRVPPRWIVLVGLGLTSTASLFFTQLSADTRQAAIAATLIASGLGLGAVLVPVMSTAIAFLRPAQMARASSTVRIFQQLGGAFAGAVVAMVLQRRIADAMADGPADAGRLAEAFGGTYWWLLAFTAVALVPALLLPGRLPDASPTDQPVTG